jgi:hypothetical protein
MRTRTVVLLTVAYGLVLFMAGGVFVRLVLG